MLENLDSIRWDELEHAYGEASDVPQMIQDLASPDAEVREGALWSLYGNIWHQGTVYEATAYAIPFLLELLEQSVVEDKHAILIYLSNLAFGNSYAYAHQDLIFLKDQRDTPEFQEQLRRELDWVRLARYEVQKGCPAYNQLLKHELAVVRSAAAYLLGLFPECAEQNLNWLQLHFASDETDEMVRAATVFAVGLLARNELSAIAWLQNIFNAETALSVRVSAAIGLAQSTPDNVSEPVLNLLIDSITNPGNAASIFEQFPWESGDIQYWCGVALACIGKHSAQVLPALIDTLEAVAPYQSWDVARWILNLIFDAQAMSPNLTVEQLSHEQRMGLQAIANSKMFWAGFEGNSIVVNAVDILRAFGLPQRPERLQAFLDGQLTPQEPTWSSGLL